MTLHPQAAAHLAATRDVPGVADLTVPRRATQRAATSPCSGPRRRWPRSRTAGSPARVLARDTGLPVVTVGYQKAPEHPFPTPLEDCLAAVRWLVDHADDLGLDPARLALVGDSAGGNLAAAATRALTDEGVPVAAQALLYPALDARRGHPSYGLFARGSGLDAADMAWFWGHYLGGADPLDPRVSPLLAPDLAGLPPTFVATAGHDVLRDEGEEYAERLRAAGVAVEAQRYAGMIHGFWWMDAVLDEARTLQRDVAAFLRARVAPPS